MADAVAEQIFVGQVVSVDRERRTIIVKSSAAAERPAAPPPRSSQGFLAPSGQPAGQSAPEEITIMLGTGFLPRGIRPGRKVRAWGDFTQDRKAFNAQRMSCEECLNGWGDATGVRRRLWRGRNYHNGGRGRGHGDH